MVDERGAEPGVSAIAEAITIPLPGGGEVSGAWLAPAAPVATYVFAHGAGAGMHHAFMAALASDLADRGVATLRYQFPYMDRGSKRVDPPAVAHAAVRAAVAVAAARAPSLPLFAGGKSFGGRMTSQAQAAAPLTQVAGLAFVGIPLHPAGKPARDRAEHLAQVTIPMLFLQGTKDELADLALLSAEVERLGEGATLVTFAEADHAFHVPARSGQRDADVRAAIAVAMAAWMERVSRGR